jgi:hypothetical protein
MGGAPSVPSVNFEVVKQAVVTGGADIVSTLEANNQKCLIRGTLAPDREVSILNARLAKGLVDQIVLVYGSDCSDESVLSKAQQLVALGFRKVRVYRGGMFEWLLLQETYGSDNFPTMGAERDMLRYAACLGQKQALRLSG